jgi:hypothetical protein
VLIQIYSPPRPTYAFKPSEASNAPILLSVSFRLPVAKIGVVSAAIISTLRLDIVSGAFPPDFIFFG